MYAGLILVMHLILRYTTAVIISSETIFTPQTACLSVFYADSPAKTSLLNPFPLQVEVALPTYSQ